MSEILLCNKPATDEYLSNTCGIDTNFIHGNSCSKPAALSAYTPYMYTENFGSLDQHLIARLSTPKKAKELTNLSLSFGGDNTVALAEMTSKLHEYNVGLLGASTSVYANRLDGFTGAVKEYQDSLMAYREAIKSNTTSRAVAKEKALRAFQNLQFRFKHELNTINAGVRARRGTPLTSSKRATNIAHSSRNVAKLNVTSQTQAHNLVKFTQHAKFLGNGLAVIDFTSRIGNVHNEYKAGGEWERELFIESSSFAASAGAGILAVNAGAAALSLLIVATPVGWVGLIIGGVAVAGASAAASITANNIVKNKSGGLYDQIMGYLSSI